MAKRKRSMMTPIKISIAFAASTTLFAMIASAVHAITDGRDFAVQLHQVSLVVMLISFLVLISVMISSKKEPLQALVVLDEKEHLSISPCSVSQFFVFDQSSVDASIKGSIRAMPKTRRVAVRVVIARSLAIPDSFAETLRLFPSMTILDLQESIVHPEFWECLEEFDYIQHVLAKDAIPSETFKNVSIALPEVKFWMSTRKLALGFPHATKTVNSEVPQAKA